MLSEQLKIDIEGMSIEDLSELRELKCNALEFVDIKRRKNMSNIEVMKKRLEWQREELKRQELENKFQIEDMKRRIDIYTEKLKEVEEAKDRQKIRCDELTEQIAYISEKIATF